MKIEDFTQMLKDRPAPNSKQMENLEKIKEISKKFHREAGIDEDACDAELDEHTIVLESGHQPNFIPHAGLFKKAFLLDLFRNKLKEKNKNPIALFGFADYNLCTAKIIHSNKIPALTKEGFLRLGFKIEDKQRWKRFNSIEKPSKNSWTSFIEQIKKHYGNTENLNEPIEKLQGSYKLAKNFSDLNAFFFSKMCECLGFRLIFFRYSDVHSDGIFLSESDALSKKTSQFNRIHNETIKKKKLDIQKHEDNDFPFWYHCSCGGKTKLFVCSENPLKCKGTCPVCKTEHTLDMKSGMKQYYGKMSMNGVARNVIFSQGLSTALFVSGSGGALRYGVISKEVSREFNTNIPNTLYWRSRDYYIGPIHYAALRNLMRTLGLEKSDLSNPSLINKKLSKKREDLRNKISDIEASPGINQRELQKYNGLYITSGKQATILAKVFKLTPSVLDVFASLGSQKLVPNWVDSISNSAIFYDGEFYRIEKSVKYPSESTYLKYQDIPKLFNEVAELEGD